MHTVAVEFDLVQPLVAFRRRVDKLGELRRDPFRKSRGARTARYRPRHAGSGDRLLRRRRGQPEMADLADNAWDNTTAPKLASCIVALAVASSAPSARELKRDIVAKGQGPRVPRRSPEFDGVQLRMSFIKQVE